MRNNIASRNLSAAARASMHTGNRPSHNSADGPVQAAESTIRHYSHSGRDHLGRMQHPEPRVEAPYKPGEVSRFAPKPRQLVAAAPAPAAKPRKPYSYADTHEVIPTTSAGYPFKVLNLATRRVTRHRSEAAALARIARDNRMDAEFAETALRG